MRRFTYKKTGKGNINFRGEDNENTDKTIGLYAGRVGHRARDHRPDRRWGIGGSGFDQSRETAKRCEATYRYQHRCSNLPHQIRPDPWRLQQRKLLHHRCGLDVRQPGSGGFG